MAQGHKGMTVSRRLWVQSPLEGKNGYLLIFSFLRSGAKPKTISKFGGQWATEYLYTMFPVAFLLCAEYSVKLISA